MTARSAQRLAAGIGLLAVILLAALIFDSVAYGMAVQAAQERTS